MGFHHEDETARWRGDWPVPAEASDCPGACMEMRQSTKVAESYFCFSAPLLCAVSAYSASLLYFYSWFFFPAHRIEIAEGRGAQGNPEVVLSGFSAAAQTDPLTLH